MSRFPGKEILYGVRDSSKVMEIEGGAPRRHPFLSKSLHKTFFFFGSLGGWDLGGVGSRRFPMNFYGSVENEMFPRWLFSLREEG